MAGGSWDPISGKERAGLYINFVNAALAQIKGGERGIVAMPITKYLGGTAQPKKFYTITTEKEAATLFGAANLSAIKRVFKGGSREILIYTMPEYAAGTAAQDYIDMRTGYEARPFNVFVYDGEVTAAEQDATLTWMQMAKDEGKHFSVVFGGSAVDDATPTIGDARSVRLADEDGYAINLTTGAVENGVNVPSAEFAPFIAGLVAKTPINKSITFHAVGIDDVTLRLTNPQVKAGLKKGSLMMIHDGEKVKIERGITTAQEGVKKIRTARARQAMQMDITKTASDNYIGKVDNNPDGQKALISAIKAYLELLARNNVILLEDIIVQLDPNYESKGDECYIAAHVTEVDSMEEIYLTIYV